MVANVRGYTDNYNFRLINFDTPRWHTLEYANWNQLDAMLIQAGIPQLKGEWLYSTLYLVGDRVFDAETNDLYRCLVQHTSASSGTFQQDRAAHPTYWALQLAGVPVFRDAWVTTQVYAVGDIVYEGAYTYYLCTVPHTSTVFANDHALGYWQEVFDATAAVNDAAQSAEDAATSAGQAADSATDAATSAGEAAISADEAEAAALNAANVSSAFRWVYDGSTSMSDPGVGNMRFNAATAAETTEIVVSAFSADLGNPDVSNWVATWDDSNNAASRGMLYIRKGVAPQDFIVLNLNSTITDNGIWLHMGVQHIANSGTVDVGQALMVAFSRSGQSGASGSGSGDMVAARNLSDLENFDEALENIGVGVTDTPTFAQIHVGVPTENTNAATKQYVDGAVTQAATDFVNVGGDTMTGHLVLPTSPAAENAVRKDYVDAADAAIIAVNTTQDTAIAGKVSKAGDTMTGDLTIANPAATSLLTLNKPVGAFNARIMGQTAGSPRWHMQLGASDAESTGNAGSSFTLNRYSDAGAFLGTALSVARATGLMTLAGDPQLPLHAATRQYVDSTAGSNKSAFVAYASAAQTIPNEVYTKVLFGGATLNQGTNFSTALSRWTPPAGTTRVDASVYFSAGLLMGTPIYLAIYKNGAPIRNVASAAVSNVGSGRVSCMEVCNGTDYFEVFALVYTIAGGAAIQFNNVGLTHFEGSMI